MTDELREKIAAVIRADDEYCSQCPVERDCFGWSSDMDCADFKAKWLIALCREELVKWGNKLCPHTDQYTDQHEFYKRECPECWQQLNTGERKFYGIDSVRIQFRKGLPHNPENREKMKYCPNCGTFIPHGQSYPVKQTLLHIFLMTATYCQRCDIYWHIEQVSKSEIKESSK